MVPYAVIMVINGAQTMGDGWQRSSLPPFPSPYSMMASQTKKLSSLMGPAVIPSGAFRDSSTSLSLSPRPANAYLDTRSSAA